MDSVFTIFPLVDKCNYIHTAPNMNVGNYPGHTIDNSSLKIFFMPVVPHYFVQLSLSHTSAHHLTELTYAI